MIRINLPDDLVKAVDQACPNEEIAAVVARVLRAEIERRRPARAPHEIDAILAAFARIQKATTPLSNDEIRELRHEGRK